MGRKWWRKTLDSRSLQKVSMDRVEYAYAMLYYQEPPGYHYSVHHQNCGESSSSG